MKKSIMTYCKASSKRIDFEVRLQGSDLLEQLAFIYLVSCLHSGGVKAFGNKYLRGDNKKFGSLQVQFKDFSSADDAYAHCNRHLDRDGCVHKTYVGALEHADPSLREARELFQQVTGRVPPP